MGCFLGGIQVHSDYSSWSQGKKFLAKNFREKMSQPTFTLPRFSQKATIPWVFTLKVFLFIYLFFVPKFFKDLLLGAGQVKEMCVKEVFLPCQNVLKGTKHWL